jgi:hypothetical protein
MQAHAGRADHVLQGALMDQSKTHSSKKLAGKSIMRTLSKR